MSKNITLNSLINKTLKDLYMDNISLGNEDLVKYALALDPEKLADYTGEEVSKFILALTQYAAFVQAQLNIKESICLYEKRKFELRLGELSFRYKGTVTEKKAQALKDSIELKHLEDSVTDALVSKQICEKIPDMVLEIVNALKKEAGRRNGER